MGNWARLPSQEVKNSKTNGVCSSEHLNPHQIGDVAILSSNVIGERARMTGTGSTFSTHLCASESFILPRCGAKKKKKGGKLRSS